MKYKLTFAKAFFCSLPVILAFLSLDTTHAGVIKLDQEHWTNAITAGGGTSDGNVFGRSQTFTVGLTGFLNHIEVHLKDPVQSHTMRILATSGDIPIGGSNGSTVLVSAPLVSSTALGSHDSFISTYDFSGSFFPVSVGDVYAIELIGRTTWYGATGNPYSGGHDYLFNIRNGRSTINWTPNDTEFDWHFRTYVNTIQQPIPEPSTFLLFAFGVTILTGYRKRHELIKLNASANLS